MKLESELRAKRESGRKLLVPYVTGGLGAAWLDVVRALADAGADAVEVGIPFSDPVMDGRTVQEASQRALDIGATPDGIIAELGRLDVDIPVVVMTYYNPVHHAGHERFASSLVTDLIPGPEGRMKAPGPKLRPPSENGAAMRYSVAPASRRSLLARIAVLLAGK